MVLVHPAGQPHNGPPGVLVPVGRAQAGEGGHHITAVGVLHLAGHVLGVGGAVDHAHLVPQPLDGRPRHKNGPLQGIGDLAVQPPGDGGD